MLYRPWVSVAAAVYDGASDSFLVIQRMDNSAWHPPGGLVEQHEMLKDAVVREVLEETGATVAVHELSGIYESPTQEVIALVFRATYRYGDLRTSDESKRVEWMPREQIRHVMTEAYACRLTDSLTNGISQRQTDEIAIL